MFMFEKAIVGSRRYWIWVAALLALMGAGLVAYFRQLEEGLGITGLSGDVTWGLYIAQFTFLVGIASSAVVVVLPYFLYRQKSFGGIVILSQFQAIAAAVMSLLFVFVDMGQPARAFNVLLYASPGSMMFWDMVSLFGYLILNSIITHVTLSAERQKVPPPTWVMPVIWVSIPWALAMRIVSALLYSGLPGRPFWMTAILAPRALSSAFASGPALLILLCLAMGKLANYRTGKEPIQKLAQVVLYAMLCNLFFVLMEIFTVAYSGIPEPIQHYRYLFLGLNGRNSLAPWMWGSVVLAILSTVFLILPKTRSNEKILAVTCGLVFLSVWIEKGIGLMVGGFVPSPLGAVTEYVPTLPEIAITTGIWACGFLMITVFYKITLSVRESLAQ
jgi:Ni/Fe-hydrogenase subunit HybB-like protein